MNKPFVLIAEDKWIGRFDSHEAADMAGLASGKKWYEIMDLREVRKMTG